MNSTLSTSTFVVRSRSLRSFARLTGKHMMSEWVKVYDLMEDTETIQLVQRATLNTKEFGLEPHVALYGSDQWWRAIGDGRIATHSVSGAISRVLHVGARRLA